MSEPVITALVIHWRTEEALARLLQAWPWTDSRWDMLIVDNGSDRERFPECPGRVIRPAENLGFAGGICRGLREITTPWALILNPDARPEPGALDELLEGIAVWPDAAGLAPALVGASGEDQGSWQLRRLPRLLHLLLEAVLLPAPRTERRSLRPGDPIEQPAAAALAFRRSALESVGGFDPLFHPAWHEDVDLACRLFEQGQTLRYWPASRFRHDQGSTVETLGYRAFLWLYHRNLSRFVGKHHGLGLQTLARGLLLEAAALRLLALPSATTAARSEPA